ncbi:MAG: hypothetical protein ABL908_21585, partial [Hyphomicrobium sp.]
YIGTNLVAQSRFRFVGDAKINDRWSAGYLMEIGVHSARLDGNDATTDDGQAAALNIRHSAWWLSNKDLGKVWVGQTSSATDAIMEINLANTAHFATQNMSAQAGNFGIRLANGAQSGLRLRSFMGGVDANGVGNTAAQIGEGERHNVVKFESVALQGFTFSAAFGEDDLWDVALRYAGEFNGIKIAAGVGYSQWTDTTTNEYNCRIAPAGTTNASCNQFGISGAVMHVPTGLYVHAAYGVRSDDNAPAGSDDSSTQFYLQAGIERKWFPLGKTTLFGEFQTWDIGVNDTNIAGRSLEMDMWGIGLNQNIEAAAMDLYIRYNNFDTERTERGVKTNFQDFSTVTAGGKINF